MIKLIDFPNVIYLIAYLFLISFALCAICILKYIIIDLLQSCLFFKIQFYLVKICILSHGLVSLIFKRVISIWFSRAISGFPRWSNPRLFISIICVLEVRLLNFLHITLVTLYILGAYAILDIIIVIIRLGICLRIVQGVIGISLSIWVCIKLLIIAVLYIIAQALANLFLHLLGAVRYISTAFLIDQCVLICISSIFENFPLLKRYCRRLDTLNL